MLLRAVLSELDPTSNEAMGMVTRPDSTIHSSAAQYYWCMQINFQNSYQGHEIKVHGRGHAMVQKRSRLIPVHLQTVF